MKIYKIPAKTSVYCSKLPADKRRELCTYIIQETELVTALEKEGHHWDFFPTPVELKYTENEEVPIEDKITSSWYYEFWMPKNEHGYTRLSVAIDNVNIIDDPASPTIDEMLCI